MNIPRITRFLPPLLLAALVASPFPGKAESHQAEASIEKIQQETRELLTALKTYTVSQRDEALKKILAAQENLDRRIEVLERQIAKNWNEMDQAAREKSLASLQLLRQQRTRVAENFGSLKSSSSAAWGHLKQGFTAAYGELHKAWEKTEEDLGADE